MNKIAVDTFLSYQFVSGPAVSPKGDYVAYFVKHANLEKNAYDSNIWLYDVKTGENKQLTTGDDATNLIWKDCSTLLFAGKREGAEKGKTQFFTISVCGGEAAPAFTVDLPVKKIEKTGDCCYVLAALYDNSVPHRAGYTVYDEAPYWSNGNGITNKKRTRLYTYCAKSNKLNPVTEELFNLNDFVLCPGKTDVIFTGRIFKDTGDNHVGLYHYNIPNETLECMIPNGIYYMGSIGFVKGGVVVAASEGKEYGGNQMKDIYFVDMKTKEMKMIYKSDESIGGDSVNCDAKLGSGSGFIAKDDKVYFLTTNNEHSYIKCLTLDGKLSNVTTADGSVNSFDLCGDTIYMAALRGNDLAEIYSVKDGKETKLSCHNDKVLSDLSISTPEFLSFTATDGYDIHGYVMKPVGYEPGKKYPAILHIHGGPRTVFGSVFHNEMQVWANAGYFVLFCNPRGSDGRGNDFGDICGKYGSVDYVNLMEFTDKCLEKYPDINPDKVGVGGGSYGGFMTNWIIGHTTRFAAAVTQRSIANWTTFEFTSDIGHTFAADQMKCCTEEDVHKMWDFSPLKYACNAKTPTLIIHAEEDYRCWMVEGLAMFQALKLHGCEARMCLLKGENHELSRSGKPQQRIKRMEEILAWYDAHLKV